jgi:hypothetical protein
MSIHTCTAPCGYNNNAIHKYICGITGREHYRCEEHSLRKKELEWVSQYLWDDKVAAYELIHPFVCPMMLCSTWRCVRPAEYKQCYEPNYFAYLCTEHITEDPKTNPSVFRQYNATTGHYEPLQN